MFLQGSRYISRAIHDYFKPETASVSESNVCIIKTWSLVECITEVLPPAPVPPPGLTAPPPTPFLGERSRESNVPPEEVGLEEGEPEGVGEDYGGHYEPYFMQNVGLPELLFSK